MSTIDPKLMWRLLDSPQQFDFFQAVTLLERLRPERAPVGEYADPHEEVVRFATPSAVGFPASQILELEEGKDGDPARIQANVDVIRGWLTDYASNVHPVGRNGMFRYNNADHSMYTAMLTAENIVKGTAHDVWSVNVEEEYHEEKGPGQPGAGEHGTGRAAPDPWAPGA